ncbi:hypothetical protein [Azospirillum sp.]|uniref:hypothetical protein n=1 Tax=Azospirillum sp. TaxID=34012 RepID=UPI002D24A515|nr:hypothetical protein [Azospirillum sp.]HYD64985.1 hypothetical protein [Azospirillum sp.]
MVFRAGGLPEDGIGAILEAPVDKGITLDYVLSPQGEMKEGRRSRAAPPHFRLQHGDNDRENRGDRLDDRADHQKLTG